MKKSIIKVSISVTFILFALLFNSISLHAQIINEGFEETQWANPGNATIGTVSVTSATSTMTYFTNPSRSSSSFTSNAAYAGTFDASSTAAATATKTSYTVSYTSSGLNTSPNAGTWYYSSGASSSDTKLSKAHSNSRSWQMNQSGYLITPVINGGIVSVTFWAASSGTGNVFIGANTATANQVPQSYGTKSTSNGFTSALQSFAVGGTMQSYSYNTVITAGAAQLGIFSALSSSVYLDDIIIDVNSGTQASVTTGNSVSPISQTSAGVSGTITANTPAPNAIVISSGVCYTTSPTALPDTSAAFNHTTDGPSNVTAGNIISTLSGLTPNSNYCVRAYAITTAGIVYGNKVCFNTLVTIAPVISTNAINVLSSVAATCSGNISDSGGLKIDSSGVCWNTTGSPTLNDNLSKDGNSASFIGSITGLKPCTKYYVRAYAANSKGISYGAELNFTTSCVPSLLAYPAVLNFGLVPIGNSATLSYVLTGALLSPATGNVTVTAPAGCLISLPGGSLAATLTIPYTGGALSPTTINVYFSPSKYGYISDSIVHNGGGAVVPNIQQVKVSGLGSQPDNVYSNVGIDFWTGFGYVEEMSNNKANMSVYIAAGDQDAVVNVDIPGLGWSYPGNPITVFAHTVTEVSNFPKTTPDSRLYYTGVSGRAVHVQSTSGVPVSVWTYTSAGDNTAAGCMNFPTNVWNSQYTVQAFGGFSNQPNPNSYFFVIANEDNTNVTITPTADIVDSNANTIFKDNTTAYVLHAAGVPFNVKLNKGQVYTGISTLSGTGTGNSAGKAFSADLSGTKVVTDCKTKIAVFGGNGRCLIDTSTVPTATNFQTVNASTGSDNLMQQMFPNSAWGTKYLSVPTKTMEDNYYRIFVQDSTKTKVTVNGVLLDTLTLINKLYYQLSGSSIATGDLKPYDTSGFHFMEINANNPISVSQFIVAGAISTDKSGTAYQIGNNGKGDPEMIILSPIQQSINSVTVATPRFQNNLSGANYINVVIPKNGVKSFRIYNDVVDSSWIRWKHVTDSAYAADPINNLPFDPTNQYNAAAYSYRRFSDTDKELVDTGTSSYISGVAYQPSATLIYLDSAFQPYPTDANYAYARFKVAIGNSYTMYSDSGFNAIAYGMDAGESYGFNAGTNLKIINIPLGQPHIVNSIDSLKNFHIDPQDNTVTITSCKSIPSHFTIGLSFKPDSLSWSFNMNGAPNPYISPNNSVLQIAPVLDSTHKYPGSDTTLYYFYTLKDAAGNPIKYTFNQLSQVSPTGSFPLTVVAYAKTSGVSFLDPCKVDTTFGVAKATYNFKIIVTKGVHPGFTPQYVSCTTDTLFKFVDNTTDENSVDPAFIIGRIWNFGNNKTDTANKTTISTSYLSSGVYPVKLVAIDKLGCIFDTTVNQSIKLKPIAKFTVSSDTICAGSSVTFTDKTGSIGNGLLDGISTWAWDYGNGSKPVFTDNSNKSSTYSQFGTFPVTLKVTNGVGCDSTYTFKSIFVSANPVANFIFPNDVCLDAAASFTNKSTIADGSALSYVWDFGDTTKKDSTHKDAVHNYTWYGPYNVSLKAYNNIGCSNTSTQLFDVLYSLIPLSVGQNYEEGFEGAAFAPVAVGGQRWHILQSPVDNVTWQRINTGIVPSEGAACAWMNNFAYAGSKQLDDLNTPVFGLPKYPGIYDSLLVKFDVAAKSTAAAGDTLEVLMSTDCNNWQTIYKKWGADLLTIHDGTENTAGEFKVNDKKYWRTDSVNITSPNTLGGVYAKILQTGGDVRFKIRNHNNKENNIYVDNFNLYVLRPNGVGFNTTTIPFDTSLIIRYNYPPTDLKRLTIYDMTGRLIYVKDYNNNAPRNIMLHPGYGGLQYMANGMYVVVMEYTDKKKSVFNFLKQ